MHILSKTTYLTLAFGASLPLQLISLQAHADNDPGFVIVGPALNAEYQGSDDYSLVPMLVSNINLDTVTIEIEGLEIRTRWQGERNWSYGAVAGFDFGRDEDVDNARIALMQEVDASINLGGFVSYHEQSRLLDGDSVEWRAALLSDVTDVHQGQLFGLTATYTLPLMVPWRIEFELESTYATSQYMNTYFGISEADALATGLTAFQADSGMRDVSFNTNIGLFFNPRWGSFLRLSATRYMGDAANSPIVKQGNQTNYFVGLGVFYRFGEGQ